MYHLIPSRTSISKASNLVAQISRADLAESDFADLSWGRSNLTIDPSRLRTAIFFEGANNMYMPTPGLGIDKVAHRYKQLFPDGAAYSAIISYSDRRSAVGLKLFRDGNLVENLTFSTIRELLEQLKPGLIGIGGTSKEMPIVTEMLMNSGYDFSKTLRIAGGIHASVAAESVMQEFAGRGLDVCFTGRADENFPLFLSTLREGNISESLKTPGTLIWTRDLSFNLESRNKRPPLFILTPSPTGDSLVPRVNRERTSSLNPLDFSFPTSDQIRLTNWGDETVLRIQTAEGCQYSCSFCGVSALTLADPNRLSQRWRPYNLERFAVFLDSIKQDPRLQANDSLMVYLEDAQIGGRVGSDEDLRAQRLLDLTSEYPFKFGIQIRYDTFLKKNPDGSRSVRHEFIDQLARGNIKYLFLSVESVNAQDLRRMDKGQNGDLDEIYSVYRALRDRGIDYMISFIGGLEGQSLDSTLKTAAFIRTLAPKHIAFEIAKVYPGTKDAVTLEATTGINVSEAYTTGNWLESYSGPLNLEEKGCLLQAVSSSEARRISSKVRDLLVNSKGSLMKEIQTRFPPLGADDYKELSPGFYTAIRT